MAKDMFFGDKNKAPERGGLFITRFEGGSFTLSSGEDLINIKVVGFYDDNIGHQVRLQINAPKKFRIHRDDYKK